MTINGDTYVHHLLKVCGGDNVFGDAMMRYPEVVLEQVPALNPDLILLPSEPYAFSEQHRYRC
jgi:ABC-type Fe3+-hydroxamate transport system substrate-binding protein